MSEEKTKLETAILRYQLLVNCMTYLTMEKNLENDALKLRVQTAIRELIKTEALGDASEKLSVLA